MAKYQAYAEYQDSGVEWLGEIPSHWDLYSLKRSVDKCTNGFWGGEPDGRNDLCVLRVADFNRDNFTINEDKLTLRSVLPKEAESRLLKKGDLLIEKSGGGEKTLVGCVVQFDKDFPAITSNFVAKMTPNVITDSKYLTYAFAHLYSGRVNFPSIKQTTGIQNLDSEAYLMEKFGFPSKNEQIQIANFLDHETSKIDHLIEKQQQLIELLKEKRQAVISHAVTKGLDPNVPMKDSGVEWLGEVPEHWILSNLKYFASIQGGYAFNSDLFVEEGTQVLRIGNVYQNTLSLDRQPIYISNELVKNFKDFIVSKNDVLMSLTGTLGKRDYGFAIKVKTDEKYLLNQRVAKISPNLSKIDTDFMVYVLWSESYLTQLYSLPSGTKQANLSNSDVLGIQIVVPPSLEEQKDIAKYLKNKLLKFDDMILKAESAISLMQERRTALISAAVTGKIDVRNWQAPTLAGAQTELSA
ncbi:restriction endonuclease subunit S [Acinetobacter baumannii]|nr:restriction endonuclease subunit S [Acinetobacter baumannii]